MKDFGNELPTLDKLKNYKRDVERLSTDFQKMIGHGWHGHGGIVCQAYFLN